MNLKLGYKEYPEAKSKEKVFFFFLKHSDHYYFRSKRDVLLLNASVLLDFYERFKPPLLPSGKKKENINNMVETWITL